MLENLQVKSAKEESKSPGEMEAKVAMVDNLVNLFIQGDDDDDDDDDDAMEMVAMVDNLVNLFIQGSHPCM